MFSKTRNLLLVACLAVAGALVAPAAWALPQTVDVRINPDGLFADPSPGSVNLTISVDGAEQKVAAGAFSLQYKLANTQDWVDFLTYCLEPDEFLGLSGSQVKQGTLVGDISATSEYTAVAAAIRSLWATHYAESLSSENKSAAFQIALWDIVFDSGNGLGTGNFKFTQTGSTATTVRDLANAYLDPSNWTGTQSLGAILRVGNQDFVVEVPEPTTLGLLSVGLLGLGFAARRRRHA